MRIKTMKNYGYDKKSYEKYLKDIENNKKENKILAKINDKVKKEFKKINDNDIIDYMKIENYKENHINLQIKLDNLIQAKKHLSEKN